MSDTNKPSEPQDDDAWLDVLTGKRAARSQDERSAEDLRAVLLEEHRQTCDEVDELQLKRLERRIFPAGTAAVTPQRSWRGRSFSSVQALAASVASCAIGLLLATAVYGPGAKKSTGEPELVMTYGNYEEMRGAEGRTSRTLEVADPQPVIDTWAGTLARDSVAFRIYRLEGGGRLLLIQIPAQPSPALVQLMSDAGIEAAPDSELALTIVRGQ